MSEYLDGATILGTAYELQDTKCRDDVSKLKSAITQYNCYNILAEYGNHSTTSNNGTQITWTDPENCKIVTPSATTGYPRFNLIASADSLPPYLMAGNKYQMIFSSDDANIRLEIMPYVSGTLQTTVRVTGNMEYTLPENTTGIGIRIWCDSNTASYNANVHVAMLSSKTNSTLEAEIEPVPIMGKMIEEYNSYNILAYYGRHATSSNNGTQISWTDEENCKIVTPSSTTGYPRFNLIESPSSVPSYIKPGNTYYIKFASTDNDIRFEIYPYIGGTIQSGVVFTGDGEYTVPSNISGITMRLWCDNNSKTYNADVYVALLQALTNAQIVDMISEIDGITRLVSTGDSTDRTSDIQAALTANGACFLGKGVFYTTGISLGWGQELVGMGKNTEIRLSDSVTNGAVITMASQSSVRDLAMRGISNSVTVSSTVGTRHGILIAGNADGAADNIPVKMTIDNVFISRLNGGGIECKNTGLSKGCYLSATNVHIYNCDAGIDVSYYSEFNHFTNVMAEGCYYGCVNNGGNNVFVNCDFSRNKMGMLLDNSTDQSPNNSHGSVIGCLFNHSDSNNGYGIKILNCPNGFVFDGCQIFYSQIYIEDSNGIIVSNSNLGSANCDITIDGGGAVLFLGDMFKDAPTIMVTDNTSVHFVNCYNRTTGAVIEPD